MLDDTTKDYCTDQFLQVRYPSGAGGKFLLSSLMLFDAIAHWVPDVQNKIKSYHDWFRTAWPDDSTAWVTHEPNQPWQLDFYSRRFFRNNCQSKSWFNQQVSAQASAYFHKCWNNDLVIVDHWHKRVIPDFFRQSRWIEIVLPKRCLNAYRDLVRRKIFLHDKHHGTIISTMDHPDYAWDDRTRENTLKYDNLCEHRGYKDYDEWFYDYLLEQHWVKPFVDAKIDQSCLLTIEFDKLLSTSGYIDIMKSLEPVFEQTLCVDQLSQMHILWCRKSGLVIRS